MPGTPIARIGIKPRAAEELTLEESLLIMDAIHKKLGGNVFSKESVRGSIIQDSKYTSIKEILTPEVFDYMANRMISKGLLDRQLYEEAGSMMEITPKPQNPVEGYTIYKIPEKFRVERPFKIKPTYSK